MIICSCAMISDKDIKRTIAWMKAADHTTLVTPGKIYRALGKTPDCGGCAPLFVAAMRATLEDDAPTHDIPMALRGLGQTSAAAQERTRHEGRPQGHRIS